MPFTKHTYYLFKASDISLAITRWGRDWIYIEDTRKNGQEDCHAHGTMVIKNGEWYWDHEIEGENFSEEFGTHTAAEILSYIRRNRGCLPKC